MMSKALRLNLVSEGGEEGDEEEGNYLGMQKRGPVDEQYPQCQKYSQCGVCNKPGNYFVIT